MIIQNTITNNSFILKSLIGFGIGFLGGLVGLILGSLRLPAMVSILKTEPKIATGTNLAASSLMCVSSLAGHLLNRNVDFLITVKRLRLMIGIVLIMVANIALVCHLSEYYYDFR